MATSPSFLIGVAALMWKAGKEEFSFNAVFSWSYAARTVRG
jgi:hypothetical protein